MQREIETHHYCARLNEDFVQCAVYDTDEPDARLVGMHLAITCEYDYLCIRLRLSVQVPVQPALPVIGGLSILSVQTLQQYSHPDLSINSVDT